MRRGAWDIHARIADMDVNGIYASLNFPSFLPGFAGQRMQTTTKDPELALAAVRAWNDWHIEDWAGPYPDRIIPCQIPYFLDPEVGADEIRKNAARGFKAVSFTESPTQLGLPSLHTPHWDPIMAACAETETVVNLHIGSSGTSPSTSDDAPPDVVGVLFFGYAMFAAVDWLYSKIPVRFPDLKICLSEGGIGWVAGLMDRLDHMLSYHEMYGTWTADIGLTPSEVLRRNFYYCAVEDPSSFSQRERIGTDHILARTGLPALRLDVAEHAGDPRPRPRRVAARRHPGRHVAQRVAPVSPPRARGGAARPRTRSELAEIIRSRADDVTERTFRCGRRRSAGRSPGAAVGVDPVLRQRCRLRDVHPGVAGDPRPCRHLDRRARLRAHARRHLRV